MVRGHGRLGWLTTVVAVVVVGAGVAVLMTGCGGSKQAAPEIALLDSAVSGLDGTAPLEKKCEKLFTALSRNLDGKQITTAAAMKSHQSRVRACFANVQKQTRAAMTPLRKILELNGISGDSKYSAQEVGDMPGAVAAAYVITRVTNGFNKQVGRAVALVNSARLGVPLGAGPLYEITGAEPVETVNTLLFLGKYRELLVKDVALARSQVLDRSAN